MIAQPFPEHRQVIGDLVSLHAKNQLPHAVLITSISGVGLTAVAGMLCATLLCEQQAEVACGECSSCSRVSAATHGDYRWIGMGEGKASIGIDQIREASDFISKTAAYGSQKTLVISEAEKMTTGAANALLKTLEEPQGNALILLLSQRAWLLPATIRSRCQNWRLPPLEPSTSIEHLRQAGIATTPEVSSNARSLERVVLSNSEGKIESHSVVASTLNKMLSDDMPVSEMAAVLQRFELIDSVEAVVIALEERLTSRHNAGSSLIALLHLHRVAASLLQRMRNGAVPARESSCYQLASLISKTGRNDLTGIDQSLRVLGP